MIAGGIILTGKKESLFTTIDAIKKELILVSDYIHENPELGNEEYKAMELITNKLESNGFHIEKNIAGIETAFTATYDQGTGGPIIGLLCEYDALQGLGHGCGHNLQPATMIGAVLAIVKDVNQFSPVTLKVIGTPAEETTSAKIPMTENGVFDDLDIALMMHGGDRTTVDGESLACTNVTFDFKGKASHAAVAPEKGRSALDSVLMTFNGIEYLREHVSSDVRMHGVITDGGVQANIVPEKSTAKFSLRAKQRFYLNEVVERVYNIAKGAALATGTELKITETKTLESKLNVPTLNEVLMDNAHITEAEQITPPRKRTGSTDFSIVTHRVPGACIRVAFVPTGVPNHTEDWVEASKSRKGHEAVITGAKIIAGTIYDILQDPDKLNEIKAEFIENKNNLTKKMEVAK